MRSFQVVRSSLPYNQVSRKKDESCIGKHLVREEEAQFCLTEPRELGNSNEDGSLLNRSLIGNTVIK